MSIYKNGKLIAGGRQCMPLLSFMWADHVLNDASWLRADTFSWQSGAVYQAAYQHLKEEWDAWWATHTTADLQFDGNLAYAVMPDGHRICGGTSSAAQEQEGYLIDIYNNKGVAWYYLIDDTNQRFKLPRTKFGFTGLRDIVGKYVPESLPNITGSSYGYVSNASRGASGALQMSGGSGKDATGGGGWWVESVTVSIDASRSSSVYGNGDTVQPKATEMYLYFYVGNFTQTALENTAGLNTELFNGKADLNLSNTASNIDFVVERQEPTAANGYTWYRKYKSGWVEQGGYRTSVSNTVITLPIPMADTNYTLIKTINNDYQGNTNSVTWGSASAVKISTTQIRLNQTSGGDMQSWQVLGMAAN